MKIKIFGERNTSTNALKQLLKANSNSIIHPSGVRDWPLAERLLIRAAAKTTSSTAALEAIKDKRFARKPLVDQWKHCATNFSAAELAGVSHTHFAFVVRHPASWALSLFKNPYQGLQSTGETIDEFLQIEWQTLEREKLGEKSFKPLELYEQKLTSYIGFIKQLEAAGLTYSLVRFEDMILEQRECFEKLRPYLDSPGEEFTELRSSTKDSSKNIEYYQDYYGNERWREELPEGFFERFTFDPALLEWAGYTWQAS